MKVDDCYKLDDGAWDYSKIFNSARSRALVLEEDPVFKNQNQQNNQRNPKPKGISNEKKDQKGPYKPGKDSSAVTKSSEVTIEKGKSEENEAAEVKRAAKAVCFKAACFKSTVKNQAVPGKLRLMPDSGANAHCVVKSNPLVESMTLLETPNQSKR